MIGLLSGTVIGVESDTVLLDVSGVGFEVRMPSADLASLHAGSSAQIFTTMNVSQDAITLFGFLSRSSKQLFIRLQKVSGIASRTAHRFHRGGRLRSLGQGSRAGTQGCTENHPRIGGKTGSARASHRGFRGEAGFGQPAGGAGIGIVGLADERRRTGRAKRLPGRGLCPAALDAGHSQGAETRTDLIGQGPLK
jgi:hypothetical protein